MLNHGPPKTARSTAVWFKVSNLDGRQVVLEEGGGARGYSIYVDQGELYVAGWDRAMDTTDTETWNGTSWTEVGDLNDSRWGLTGNGTVTSA